MLKLCKKCSTEKPLSAFHNDAARPDSKYPHCRECHQSYMRNRYATDPAVKAKRIADLAERKRNDPNFTADAKRRSEKLYSSVKGRAQSLLRSAQKSPDGCTIDIDFVIRGIERGSCPVTGIRFDLTNAHQLASGRAKNPYAPSLDRIDSKGSYSPENTRVVIWQYNMAKGELTDAEVLFMCRQVTTRAA